MNRVVMSIRTMATVTGAASEHLTTTPWRFRTLPNGTEQLGPGATDPGVHPELRLWLVLRVVLHRVSVLGALVGSAVRMPVLRCRVKKASSSRCRRLNTRCLRLGAMRLQLSRRRTLRTASNSTLRTASRLVVVVRRVVIYG